MSKTSKQSNPMIELELEEPVTIESPEAGVSTLFADQIPQMAAKLSVLEGLLTFLTKDLTFNDFMRECLFAVMRAIKCEAGSFLEVNHEKQVLFFRTAAGFASDQITQFVIPVGKGIAGHVVESKEPFHVANVAENAIHLKSIQKAVGFNARNMIAVPIIIRGKVFGVLELLNRIGEPDFSTCDVELSVQICAFLAKAIELRLMLGWSLKRKADAA